MTYQTPARVTKASELIKQLRSYDPDDSHDFVLRKMEREARKLIVTDPIGAHSALGILTSLRGNAENVRYHYDIALQQSGGSVDVLHNYSVCLLQVGEVAEAVGFAREAFQRAPDNSVVLRQSILAAIESAHFGEARDLCDHWIKLFQDLPVPYESEARALAGAVERGVFREESVRETLRIAQDVQNSANVRRMVETIVWEDCTEPDSFLCKFRVFASPGMAADLNKQFSDRIAARPDLMTDPGLAFVPMFIGFQVDGCHS